VVSLRLARLISQKISEADRELSAHTYITKLCLKTWTWGIGTIQSSIRVWKVAVGVEPMRQAFDWLCMTTNYTSRSSDGRCFDTKRKNDFILVFDGQPRAQHARQEFMRSRICDIV
jgi:hypothetical protein